MEKLNVRNGGMVGVDTEDLLLFLLIFVEDAISITSHQFSAGGLAF